MQFLAAGIAQRAARQHVMMRVANVAKERGVLGAWKQFVGIAAEKGEPVTLRESVPEFFETQRSLALTLFTEQRNHFPKRMERLAALRRLRDDRADC